MQKEKTVFFYSCQQKPLHQKNEKCFSGKMTEEGINVLLCCIKTGEKS